MNITLTAVGRGRTKVECDSPAFCDIANLDQEKNRSTIARRLSIEPAWFIGKTPGVYAYTPPVVTIPLNVTIRAMRDPSSGVSSSGDALAIISAGLTVDPAQFDDPIITWEGTSDACFLDVDYHHIPESERPRTLRLQFIMSRVQPQPALWFVSRNGGVHALYVKQGNFPADVLAAVASFAYRSHDPTALYDILPHSRLPTAGTPVHTLTPTTDLSAARRFLTAGVEESEIEKWLADRGIERGKAYDHSYCPYEPSAETKGHPVWMGDNGVRCHRCEAKGVLWGSRYPGFFPYSSVIGSHGFNDVATMVRNFTHYTHAEVVLNAKCRIKGKHARLAYEGMLRLVHGDDDRIANVFKVGEYLLRGNGEWVTPDRYESIGDCRSTLATLPAVCNRAGRPIPERLDLFDSTVDLSRYGYIPLKPLHGMRIFGEFLGGEGGDLSLVIPPASLHHTLHPRYVPAASRLPLATAWERVETVFPGISREYLQLLIAARGVAEGGTGMPANIICVGPSSTGKSSIALLAASMLGDGCGEAPWTAQIDRFRQAYMEACNRGMFVVVNEIFKNAKQARMPPRAAMDTFLNITPGSMSHKMYVGPVRIGRLPVTILTDTKVPNEIHADLQLGRRFIYVHLMNKREWEESFARNGIGQDCNYRASSPEAAEACNAIVSHVIDTWFRDRPLTLKEIASDLGFTTLEHCNEVIDDPDAIPNLYAQLLAAPDYTDTRHNGRGWKRVEFGDDTLLARAWESVCDGLNSFDSFATSRKVFETDLSTILPVPEGTQLDVSKTAGKAILLRFRYGQIRGRGEYWVNQELASCPGVRRETTLVI